MQIEFAELSLLGHREDNQDRSAVAVAENAALIVAIDGMGGHSDGARAAEVARQVLLDAFWAQPHPVFDPLGFLHLSLGRAHEQVAALGARLPIDQRPRATCALALVQEGSAYFAHIGDSRVYHLRHGDVRSRTRDHSHVEMLLREGMIREDEVHNHPMRNFVECCLGGDPALPEMTLSMRRVLAPNDVVLVCSDGLWANLSDPDIAGFWRPGAAPLKDALAGLAERAVAASAPHSDNTTAAALRWMA